MMTTTADDATGRELFDSLAALLEYPEHDWVDRLDACERTTARAGDAVAGPFLAFRDALALPLDQVQEGYVRTFEMAPDHTLEVGFHLFGESYKRGEFLANLREEEARFDIGQEKQLPDYLPVLLRLIVRLDDDELRRDLLGACVLPAVEKLLATLATKQGPYGALMTCVAGALERRLRLELELDPDAIAWSEPVTAGGPQYPENGCSASALACTLENGHA